MHKNFVKLLVVFILILGVTTCTVKLLSVSSDLTVNVDNIEIIDGEKYKTLVNNYAPNSVQDARIFSENDFEAFKKLIFEASETDVELRNMTIDLLSSKYAHLYDNFNAELLHKVILMSYSKNINNINDLMINTITIESLLLFSPEELSQLALLTNNNYEENAENILNITGIRKYAQWESKKMSFFLKFDNSNSPEIIQLEKELGLVRSKIN